MSTLTYGNTAKNVDVVGDVLCNLMPHLSVSLVARLHKELAAGQITTQTKTDVMTAFQRSYDEVLAAKAPHAPDVPSQRN